MLRDFGFTKRCHTERTVGPAQTVAEHSWGVAVLALDIWPDVSKELLVACLLHDVPERIVGDPPAFMKKLVPGMKENYDRAEGVIASILDVSDYLDYNLSPQDVVRLKICDWLELVLYCQDQLKFGNGHISWMYNNICEYLQEYLLDLNGLVGASDRSMVLNWMRDNKVTLFGQAAYGDVRKAIFEEALVVLKGGDEIPF